MITSISATVNLHGRRVGNLIRRDHFKKLAEASRVDAAHVITEVDQAVHLMREAWQTVRKERSLYPALVDHIDKRLTSLPLAAGA